MRIIVNSPSTDTVNKEQRSHLLIIHYWNINIFINTTFCCIMKLLQLPFSPAFHSLIKNRADRGAGSPAMDFIHLLVCQHRIALQWRQVAVEQGGTGSVMLTEDCAIDVMEAITRHQSVSTGGTAETLKRKHRHLLMHNGDDTNMKHCSVLCLYLKKRHTHTYFNLLKKKRKNHSPTKIRRTWNKEMEGRIPVTPDDTPFTWGFTLRW